MTEHPIICSTPMIPPILDGIKTETRRLTGLQYLNEKPDFYTWLKDYNQMDIPREAKKYDKDFYYAFTGKHNNSSLVVLTCRYGKPGDILWVRETWKVNTIPMGWPYHYLGANDTFNHPEYEKWKPSIHMPRKAARIFLKVTSIEVERLQQITEQGAIAEGISFFDDSVIGVRYKDYMADATGYGNPKFDYPTVSTAIESYQSLWTKLHGRDSWEQNPWVWVIKFKHLKDYDARN